MKSTSTAARRRAAPRTRPWRRRRCSWCQSRPIGGRIILREAERGLIRLGFLNLLHAADVYAHFPGCFDDLVEQMTDNLVTGGGDADRFPACTSAQIIRAPVWVLPAPGGPSIRKNTAIERRCDP